MLDADKYTPPDYHSGLTVAKSFALAISEAAKLHPAAESLIAHAALLAPEPIPLFLFSEAREEFGEPLASQLVDQELDEAVAALRAFALVNRETIQDERDPAICTETIRLHRVVRVVAANRLLDDATEAGRRVLVEAMATVYPRRVAFDPNAWPRARRLDALAFDLVSGSNAPRKGVETAWVSLMQSLVGYRISALADHAAAKPIQERLTAFEENTFGPEHPTTGTYLLNLGFVLFEQGDLAGAQPLFERALAIFERARGMKDDLTAFGLNALGRLLQAQGDLTSARPLLERALAIFVETFGPESLYTALGLKNLAKLLQAQGDLVSAWPLFERALSIYEKERGPEHPHVADVLNDLANLLRAQGNLTGARSLFERALAIREKAFGPEHPDTTITRTNLAQTRLTEGDTL